MNKYYTVFVLHHQWWCVLHSSTTTPYTNASVNGSNLSPKIHQSFHDIPHPCPQNTLSPPKFMESTQGCFLLSFLSYPWHELVSPDISSLNLSPCPSESLGLPAFAPKFASPKFNTSPEAHQNSHHRLQLKNWIFVPHGYSTDLSSEHLTGYSQQPSSSRLQYPCWPMKTLAHDHVTLSEK